jgi:copper chaperone
MAEEHTYKFNVSMSCGGCSGAVNRVLGKLEGMSFALPGVSASRIRPNPVLMAHAGVKSYDVSLDTQTATVLTEPSLDYETVLKTIKKTGKKVNSGEADGETKSVELAE